MSAGWAAILLHLLQWAADIFFAAFRSAALLLGCQELVCSLGICVRFGQLCQEALTAVLLCCQELACLLGSPTNLCQLCGEAVAVSLLCQQELDHLAVVFASLFQLCRQALAALLLRGQELACNLGTLMRLGHFRQQVLAALLSRCQQLDRLLGVCRLLCISVTPTCSIRITTGNKHWRLLPPASAFSARSSASASLLLSSCSRALLLQEQDVVVNQVFLYQNSAIKSTGLPVEYNASKEGPSGGATNIDRHAQVQGSGCDLAGGRQPAYIPRLYVFQPIQQGLTLPPWPAI